MAQGLPNITASFYSLLNGGANNGQKALTAVQTEHAFTGTYGENVNCWWLRLYFDASRSNPLYGNSDLVQPASLILQYLIKY